MPPKIRELIAQLEAAAGPIMETLSGITIATTADSTVELDETMTVALSALVHNGRSVTILDGDATGTITNDDTPYSSWAADGLLSVGQNGPTQMPMGDGVTNLEKFAFNLNPLSVDCRRLTVGANDHAGLPGAAMPDLNLQFYFLLREMAFGNDAAFWMHLQVAWDMHGAVHDLVAPRPGKRAA